MLAGKGQQAMTEDTPIPKKLNLTDTTQGGGQTQLDILISDTDDLVMEGYDTGPAVEDFFGDSDYEYWVTVSQEYKDWLLLNLIKETFASDPKPSSTYMEWLKKKGIPYKFVSF
jgi:hypothetical protein